MAIFQRMDRTHRQSPQSTAISTSKNINPAQSVSAATAPIISRASTTDTDNLSTTALLQLQNTVGNHAVTALLSQRNATPQRAQRQRSLQRQQQPGSSSTVQRALLPNAATFVTLDLADALLVAVGNAAVAYNVVAAQVTPEGYQNRFNLLQTTERAIYAWFAHVSANNQRLSGNANTAQVEPLRAAVDAEHQALVAATKDMVDILPLDTRGMDDEDKAALKTLWQEMVNNRGKVKLSGSDGYKQRVLSELGRILATPTGRAMLAFLNAPPPGEVGGTTAAALTNIYIGDSIAALPGAVKTASPTLEDAHVSEAQPLNIDDSKGRTIDSMTGIAESPLGGGVDPGEYPAVAPGNLGTVRDSAWGTGKGFTHSGKKYDFNKNGTGAYITSFPGKSLNSNAAGNELMTPGWTTMGHELGHAANMRAGATTLGYKPAVGDTLTGTLLGDAEGAKRWDNAEELLNIQNVENALRSESGQGTRAGHQTPAWAVDDVKNTKTRLRAPLTALFQEDPNWSYEPTWAAIDKDVRTTPAKAMLDGDDVEAGLQRRVTAFMLTVPAQPERALRKQARDAAVLRLRQIRQVDNTWQADNDFIVLRKRLDELPIPQTVVLTVAADVEAFLMNKVNTLLSGYLLQISDNAAKRQALLGGLPTNADKIAVMLYLHGHTADFVQIKASLHYNKARRKGTTTAARALARIATLRGLAGI